MKIPDIKRTLRLALSYRDSVNAQLAASDESSATGNADPRHAALLSHLQQAESAIEALRDTQRRTLLKLEETLSTCIVAQSKLTEEVSQGRLTPENANKKSRRVATEIDRLKTLIADTREALVAENPEQLGGHLAFDLDHYPKQLKRIHARKISPIDLIASVIAIASVLVMILVTTGRLSFGPDLEFDAQVFGRNGQFIRVSCRNHSTQSFYLHLPWEETHMIYDDNPQTDPSRHIGIELYVRQAGVGEWRLLPYAQQAWTYRSNPIAERGILEIQPALAVEVVLDKSKIDLDPGTAPTLRISLTYADGQEVDRFETPL